ncbi:UNVERIFIED_CONTAM: hypothetical protein HDU68_011976 [Siphonaria sp. JEL0065]|nr:hypothetical protein HDU68_011976 [Siphonaria sp. JEL0065]
MATTANSTDSQLVDVAAASPVESSEAHLEEDRSQPGTVPLKIGTKQQRYSKQEKAILVDAMRTGCDATKASRAARADLARQLNTDEERIRQWFANNRKLRETLLTPQNKSPISTTSDNPQPETNHPLPLPQQLPLLSLPPPPPSHFYDPSLGLMDTPKSHPSPFSDVEKGPRRTYAFRDQPTKVLKQRIERALSLRQRLLAKRVISPTHTDYKVISSTQGAAYTCSLKKDPECECVDWEVGKNCKHLLFVLLKVLKRDPSDPLVYQKSLLQEELEDIFRVGRQYDPIYLYQQTRLRSESKDLPVRVPIKDDSCALCYETFIDGDDTIWCQASCGGNIHKECWAAWKRAAHKAMIMIRCPHCGGNMTKVDELANKALHSILQLTPHLKIPNSTPLEEGTASDDDDSSPPMKKSKVDEPSKSPVEPSPTMPTVLRSHDQFMSEIQQQYDQQMGAGFFPSDDIFRDLAATRAPSLGPQQQQQNEPQPLPLSIRLADGTSSQETDQSLGQKEVMATLATNVSLDDDEFSWDNFVS